jgi:hypothetical protein
MPASRLGAEQPVEQGIEVRAQSARVPTHSKTRQIFLVILDQKLAAGDVIVLDGATGTETACIGGAMDSAACCAVANKTHPDSVRQAHESYLQAGADIITTNTFAFGRGHNARTVSEVCRQTLNGPMAWTATTAIADGGRLRLDSAMHEELVAVAQILPANGMLPEIVPDDFHLPACRAAAQHCRHLLDNGPGFVIIEDFPLDAADHERLEKLFWLFASLVSRPVEQNIAGQWLWQVRDTGRQPAPGNGVRASQSNLGQEYHTDNNCGVPPHYVALLCLHGAKRDGESGLISFDTVHNHLLADHAEKLARAYKPFPFDRQRDYLPGDSAVLHAPIFEYGAGEGDGCSGDQLYARFCPSQIRQGYVLQQETIDPASVAVLDAMIEVMARPGLARQFEFAPGEIQLVNNRRIGHRRNAFEDWTEPERRRHLLRLWLRDQGDRRYLG